MANKKTYQEPAASCIERLGGASEISRYLGCHPSTVCRWRRAKTDDGTGGVIPYDWHDALIQLARTKNLNFKREYFVNGAF